MKGVGLDQMLRDLCDADPEIKKMAARAILKESSNPAKVFSSVLKDADGPTSEAIYDILFDADADFSGIFMSATEHEDPVVRARAIRYLFRRGPSSRRMGPNGSPTAIRTYAGGSSATSSG